MQDHDQSCAKIPPSHEQHVIGNALEVEVKGYVEVGWVVCLAIGQKVRSQRLFLYCRYRAFLIFQMSESKIKLGTAPFDARFPNTNQTKNCWQNYLDFHRCSKVKGDDHSVCMYFKKTYKSLCPESWVRFEFGSAVL